MIRVVLPAPLVRLGRVEGTEVQLDIGPPYTQRRVLDALEARYPALIGTTRDQRSGRRRAYVRFFAEGRDLSDAGPDEALPEAVVSRARALSHCWGGGGGMSRFILHYQLTVKIIIVALTRAIPITVQLSPRWPATSRNYLFDKYAGLRIEYSSDFSTPCRNFAV